MRTHGLILAACILMASAATAQETRENASDLAGYLSANGLLNRGLFDLAEKEYRAFLDAHPRHEKAPVARYGLAVACLKQAKFDEALENLAAIQVRKGFPFAVEVAVMKGQCLAQKQQWKEAAEILAPVARDHADHALADDAAALRVDALLSDGAAEAAAAAGGDFLTQWPKSPLADRVTLALCTAESNLNRHESALERAKKWLASHADAPERDRAFLIAARSAHALGRLDDARAAYRAVTEIKDSPWLNDARLGLATLLRESGAAAEAEALLKSLRDGGAALDPRLQTAARFQRARLLLDQGRFEDAQTEFEALASQPDAAIARDAAYWASKCRLRGGSPQEAAARLAQLVRSDPQNPNIAEMRYDLAVSLLKSERFPEAVKSLSEFLEAHPSHALAPEAIYLAAAALHRLKDFEQSLSLCHRFAKSFPKHDRSAAVALLCADNLMLANRSEEAAKAYDDFVARFPDDAQRPAALLRCGQALLHAGKADEAEKRLSPLAAKASSDAALRPALLALGEIAFQKGDLPRAETLLADYLRGDSVLADADDALLKLALARLRAKKPVEALGDLDRLLRDFPRSPHRLQAMFERGQALVALNRPEDAKAAFEAVLGEDPKSRFAAPAHQHLAALAAARKDMKVAAEQYRLAADVEPQGSMAADATLRRGEMLLAAGEVAEAEAVLAGLLREAGKASTASRIAAQLAIARSRKGDYEAALKTLDRAGAGLETLDSRLRRAVQLERAYCLRKLGKTEQAAAVYGELVNSSGDAPDLHALVELAQLEAEREKYEPAAELLRRFRTATARQPAPDNLREAALYRLGVCEFKLGRHREAAEVLDEFIRAFDAGPLIASASYFCGESLYQLGAFDRACGHFARVVERFPKDAACEPSLLRLGESQAQLQKWAESERTFLTHLERFSSGPLAYQARFGVGWARENLGRIDEAIAAYKQVIDAHKGPTAARAQFQIGECLFARRQYEDAVREFLKVDILYAYPEWSAAALYEAGRCLEQLNKLAEARTQYATVVEKHAKTKWADLAAERLKVMPKTVAPGRDR
ncbi:MAG: tetratricopeptide repeat protein [Phycisphaerales bacterium]|nr:tetratricopeptide repeat protein [Phycisphaerales bacterium]